MEFNFYDQYKTWSNIDLMKIIKRPNEYQQAAVAAASQILNERSVAPEEIELVDQYYGKIDDATRVQNEKIDGYKNKATDLLEPVLQPNEKLEPNKWLNILLILIALQYGWALFTAVRHLVRFWHYGDHTFDSSFVFYAIDFIYIPVMFFLLYKRKKWGWILLFANQVMALIQNIFESYLFFKYSYNPYIKNSFRHYGNLSPLVFHSLVCIAFIVFLWRDGTARLFNVTPIIKKVTTIVAAVLATLMYFIF